MKRLTSLKYYLIGFGFLLLYPFLQIFMRVSQPETYRFYNLGCLLSKAYREGKTAKAESLALE